MSVMLRFPSSKIRRRTATQIDLSTSSTRLYTTDAYAQFSRQRLERASYYYPPDKGVRAINYKTVIILDSSFESEHGAHRAETPYSYASSCHNQACPNEERRVRSMLRIVVTMLDDRNYFS